MAKKKVSELPVVTELLGGEMVPVVQGGASKRALAGAHLATIDPLTGKVRADQIPADPGSTQLRDDLSSVAAGKGAALVAYQNVSGTEFGGATTAQDALESVRDDYVRQADAQAVIETTTIAPGDFVIIELAGGGFRKVQAQIVTRGAPALRSFGGTSDTLALTDLDGAVLSTGSAANTVNIPTDAAVAFQVNATVEVVQKGSGVTKVQAPGTVTLNGALGGFKNVPDRYGSLQLRKIGSNEWTAVEKAAGVAVTDTTPPTLISSSPADNATNVVVGVTIVITFSEDIAFGTGNILLRQNNGGWATLYTFDVATEQGTTAGKVNAVGNQLFIYPDATLANSREFAVQIAGTCITDLAGNAFAGIANDTTLSFTTVAAAPTGPTVVAQGGAAIAAGSLTQSVALSGLAQNDKIIIFSACDGTGMAAPSGYSAFYDATSVNNPSRYIYHKTVGAVPDTSIAVPQVFSRRQAFGYVVLRGANLSTFDGQASILAGSVATGASGSPDAPAYAQGNAQVLRFIVGFLDDDETTMTAPAGWTQAVMVTTNGANAGEGASLIVAYQAAGGLAGDSVNPGAFTGADDEWVACHFGQH